MVHGYGGLDIDTSSSNVSKAYQDVGYNVIIGINFLKYWKDKPSCKINTF